MKKFFVILAFTLFIQSIFVVVSGQIYVSPAGNDRFKGTKKKPVASFARAQELARQADKSKPLDVIFLEGVYYLPEEITFTHQDSRSSDASVTYKAEKEGTAIISGGSKLSLTWKPFKDGIYVAKVKGNPVIDQLYVNGKRQRMARFPDAVEGKNVFDKWNLAKSDHWDNEAHYDSDGNDDPFDPKRIRRWNTPNDGYIHAMHNALWGGMHWKITGKANDTTLLYEGGWQNNRPAKMHYRFRFVENIFEELNAPGEWYHNASTGQIFFFPPEHTDLKTASVEIVRLKSLIDFKGSKDAPVSHVNLKGFTFRHVARTFMENKEPLGRSDWTIFRGGAVFYDGAVDCSITDCEFDQVGGNAVFVNNYNRDIKISRCYIHESGASGVLFIGDPGAVRSYLVGYIPQDYTKLDTIKGSANDNYPSDCMVEDCLITRVGRYEKQTAGVQISMSENILVRHVSIYDVPRAGINIGEGAFGGHIIEYCDVFNTVLETGDHGSFNSWGRDRFWSPDIRKTAQEVSKNPRWVDLDMADPNIIRNSRWKCEYGWDVDLDDGSSNYLIYNNLMLSRGLKLREGYNRIVTNNIMINNGLHPHVWYPNSGDVFKHNIVFKAHQPAVMNRGIAADGHWGKELDYNFYVATESEMRKFSINGCDRNSINGDPLFVNPQKGDFRVQENSSALKMGFVNFPMDKFGVQHPTLKAIAKSPEMPVVKIDIKTDIDSEIQKKYSWFGASLHTPVGDELSAYGVNFSDGGVALIHLPENSDAAKLGFMSGDLIQEINKVKIKNISDFIQVVNTSKSQSNYEIHFIRNQVKSTKTIHKMGDIAQ
jgi:hypothetical protein